MGGPSRHVLRKLDSLVRAPGARDRGNRSGVEDRDGQQQGDRAEYSPTVRRHEPELRPASPLRRFDAVQIATPLVITVRTVERDSTVSWCSTIESARRPSSNTITSPGPRSRVARRVAMDVEKRAALALVAMQP